MGKHAKELIKAKRFEFGRNWQQFLKDLGEDRIAEAERSLKEMLGVDNLIGNSFLDIGSGSGLFSLAARRLGAKVHSFDYDPLSVACTAELKNRYLVGDPDWVVERGSALDEGFVKGLPKFDIVYSWSVLHHTGAMCRALSNVAIPVGAKGKLLIAIYNDQGSKSHWWRMVKRLYCSNMMGRILVVGAFFPYFFLGGLTVDLLRRRNPLGRYREYKKTRGMSAFRDWIDWLGGYPFDVAKPEQIFDFFKARGYRLERLKTCGGGLGNNEFVFVKNA